MKKFTQLMTMVFVIVLSSVLTVFGQIPPEQAVVIIPAGVDGVIETTINGDTLVGGVRANSNRIYMLQKDQAYVMKSKIIFGGGTDTTSTLIIVGEEGGKKPIVFCTPTDNGSMFRNSVLGSLKLKNIYWPSMATNGTGNTLFELQGTNLKLEVEDFVGGNQINADVFGVKEVGGTLSVFFKNSYFRDATKFKNPWNYALITRGTRPIDTLWVENTTVVNGGLLFLGTGAVNFGYFNHNTITNIPKYWLYFEQWKEAYFVNNIMINCNWQGESQEMMMSQKESQKLGGPIPVGLIDIMEPTVSSWEFGFGAGSAPKLEDIKWMASHNLSFTSPFLNKYYNGEFNDVGNYPISNIDWGFSAGAGLELPMPHPVVNVPTMFFSAKTEALIATYDGIKADDNHDNVDPVMVTKMIADQTEGDAYAVWARNDYKVQVTGEARPAATVFTIGDFNPQTVPGVEGENGSGFATVRDLPEDLTYTADIKSGIDGRPLGALEWWANGLDNWDSELELEKVKTYYENGINIGIEQERTSSKVDFTIYPNPANDMLKIQAKAELSKATIYDVTGRMVKQIRLNGALNSDLDISSLTKGIFFLEVETIKGKISTTKFMKN